MPPCTRPHCPSYKHSRHCQHHNCTRALRNRLERRRSERDNLKTALDLETTSAMRTLCDLRENCSNKLSRDLLSRVKREFEERVEKRGERQWLGCFCVECEVESKEREISGLRRGFERLEVVRRAVAVVRERMEERKGKATRMSPPAWNQHVRHAPVQPKSEDVMGMGLMEGLPVGYLVDRDIIIERVTIPGRAHR